MSTVTATKVVAASDSTLSDVSSRSARRPDELRPLASPVADVGDVDSSEERQPLGCGDPNEVWLGSRYPPPPLGV